MSKFKNFILKNSLIAATAVIMVICAFCIAVFSGFLHEGGKVKSILVNVFVVTVLLFLVSDTIKFLVLSMDAAWWPRTQASYNIDKNATIHTRTHYLKMRINTLRSQLVATEKHCNEPLNLMYQINARDLWLYGKYFLLLMCLVLVSWDELLYYNTKQMYKLYMNNQTRSLGVVSVRHLHGLFAFLESALVAPFEPDLAKTGQRKWLYGDHTTKLGVIRLRQLRRKENYHIGWGEVKFSDLDFMPSWELPYQRMLYTDKYWKIYEPWLPIYPTHSTTTKMLFGFDHYGYTQSFPELHGYVTMLARSYNNSMKVIDYIKNMNWLTWNTSAVFIDFTLYNVDANIFTICTVLIEQTPFGDIISSLNIFSVKLQFLDQLGILGIIVVTLYLIVLIQFGKSVVVTLWYEPSKLRSMWSKLDLIILVLNLIVIVMVIIREIIVSSLLAKVESSINDYFVHAKHQRDAKGLNYINFLQFLRVEYAPIVRFFQKLPFCKRGYKRRNRTVTENINFDMEKSKRWNEKKRYQAFSLKDNSKTETIKGDEKTKQQEYIGRIERLYTVAALMQTQISLLDHLLFREETVNLDESDNESDSETENV
ncbi:polycystin-2-like [Drosophila montana]|uniref:polycystin-2-like n=1 Tax=Drosophila montana TaxID=40370 RepID=UPI00313C5AF7